MKKILAIADEKSIRNTLLKILKAEHFDAIEAQNGAVGMQLATLLQPDLIICDIMMPDMDGYQVLAALQENPETAGIPFIFLTPKTLRMDMRKIMHLGADCYINKPFDGSELLEAIALLFKKRASIEQRLHRLLEQQQESSNANEATSPNFSWNIERLYASLAKVKQQQKTTNRRVQLTALEKACLQGILNGYSPNDIATQLNREPKGLNVDLSRGLYRYIEALTGYSPKNWRDIPILLEKAGYKKVNGERPTA